MSPFKTPLRRDLFAGQLGSMAGVPGLATLLNEMFAPGSGSVFYVGKNGNDSNQGDSVNAPFLTFTHALSEVSVGDVVVCLDAGSYQEELVVPAGVSLFAPNATITTGPDGAGDAAITLETNTDVTLNAIVTGGNQDAVVRSNTPGTGTAHIKLIDCRSGSGSCVFNKGVGGGGGILIVEVEQIYVGTGVGIGSTTQGIGHTHIDCEDIYLYGDNSVGLSHNSGGGVVGRITHILEDVDAAPTGTTAIIVQGGRMDLMINVIVADTTWNVTGAGILSLFYNQATGTPAGAGTVLLSTPV